MTVETQTPAGQPQRPQQTGSTGRPGTTARLRVGDGAMRYASLFALLVGMVVFFTVSESQFATTENVLSILETSAPLLVVSVGLTIVMLAGGFDLSIAGVVPLASVVLAKFLEGGLPVLVAIVVVVGGGLLYGAVMNGLPVARLKVNFFVITLGSLALTEGLALAISQGSSVPLYDQTLLRDIGSGRVGGIPIPVIIAGTILALAFWVTRYTGFGRMLYAVGGNAEAARLAGINVLAVRIAGYAIGSGLAATGGVLLSGRLAAGSPDVGQDIFLSATAAVLIGGTSFAGGSGGMAGTFFGVVFLGTLANGLLISGISVLWQGVVTGGVLIASAILDRLRGGAGG